MLGKTHFTVGIAAALAVTHPSTVPGVIAAIAAGGIGGKLPDVDCKKIKLNCESVYDTILDFLVMWGFLSLDYLSGNGMCQYILDNWGFSVWLGLAGFFLLLLVGLRAPHRSFTHSLLCLLLFSASVFFFCQPATIPFFVGYASHLFIDLFNKRGIRLFYPLKWKPKLNLCDAGGKVNRILFQLGFTVDMLAGSFFFASAMLYGRNTWQLSHQPTVAEGFGAKAIFLYLVFINLIAFFAFQRRWAMADSGEFPEPNWFDRCLPGFTALIGGVGGMLLSLLLRKIFRKH